MRKIYFFLGFFSLVFSMVPNVHASILDNITGKTRKEVIGRLSELAATVELWIINQQMLDMRSKIMGGVKSNVALKSFDKKASKDVGHKERQQPKGVHGYFDTSKKSQDPSAPTQVDLLNAREKHLGHENMTKIGVRTIQGEVDKLMHRFTAEIQANITQMTAEQEVLQASLGKAKKTDTNPGWFMQYGAKVGESLGGLGSLLSNAMNGLEDSSEKRKVEKVGTLSKKLAESAQKIAEMREKIEKVNTEKEYVQEKRRLEAKLLRLQQNLANIQRVIDQTFAPLVSIYGDDAEKLANKRIELLRATGCDGDTTTKLSRCVEKYVTFLKKKLPKAKIPSCAFLYSKSSDVLDGAGNIKEPLESLEKIHACQLDYLTKFACKKEDAGSDVCRAKIIKLIQKKLKKIQLKLGKDMAKKCAQLSPTSGITVDTVQCLEVAAVA